MNPSHPPDSGSRVDHTIRVCHGGGRGNLGPVEQLFKLRENLSLSICEADIESGDAAWKTYDRTIHEYATRYGIRLAIVPHCLSNTIGRKPFHINAMPDCSSLLTVSPRAESWQRMNEFSYRIVWGEICRPARTVEVNVTTLDQLIADGKLASPHFLSLDIQGAEFAAMEGATSCFEGDLMGVITEVEFREMYAGQKLFADQHAFLHRHQFDLYELQNPEYWYSGPIQGKGALTVAEALFLRDFRYFIDQEKDALQLVAKLAKLALIAHCFQRDSYAVEILDYVTSRQPAAWGALLTQPGCTNLDTLIAFHRKSKAGQARQQKIPTYAEFMRLSAAARLPCRIRAIPRLLPKLDFALIRTILRRLFNRTA